MAYFTDSEIKTLVTALRRSWDYIAGDVFQNYADCGEPVPDSLPREDVMELAADCSRPLQFGVDTVLMQKFYDSSNTEWNKVAKKAFPHAKYC